MATRPKEGVTTTSIFQDAPTNGLGAGETGPPMCGSSARTTSRSAQSAPASATAGPAYVNFTANDRAGRSCPGTATIFVPHDQAHEPVGVGQLFNSIP